MAIKEIQLDFFSGDLERRDWEFQEFKKQATKSLRGLFARYNELESVVLSLQNKLEEMTEKAPNNEG